MAVIISRRSFYCPNFATAPLLVTEYGPERVRQLHDAFEHDPHQRDPRREGPSRGL